MWFISHFDYGILLEAMTLEVRASSMGFSPRGSCQCSTCEMLPDHDGLNSFMRMEHRAGCTHWPLLQARPCRTSISNSSEPGPAHPQTCSILPPTLQKVPLSGLCNAGLMGSWLGKQRKSFRFCAWHPFCHQEQKCVAADYKWLWLFESHLRPPSLQTQQD